MSITGIGAVFAGLVLAALLAGLKAGPRAPALVLGAAIPLSASAAAVLGWAGGASLPVAVLAAAGFVAACLAGAVREVMFGGRLGVSGAGVVLVIFTLIALVGAYASPRIFAGMTLTFPLDRTAIGVTDGALKLPLLPLAPRASAVTQSAYLLSSTAVFLAALWALRRDQRVLSAALWGATGTQALFGGLDAVGWGGMEFLRTAAYQIAPTQDLAGFVRVVGAATEPSQFGLVSAVLAAWHLWRWREGGGATHLCAATVMMAFAVSSLSTTALIALLCALTWFAMGAAMRPRGPGFGALVASIGALCVAGMGWAALGPHAGAIETAFNAMLTDKLTSESGVERAYWARQSLTNFVDTFGFGSGLGSAKASGWLTALLGQTGAPGALLMLVFLISVFVKPTANRAARAAAAVWMIGALLSEARVDLGYLFFLTSAGALAGRAASSAALTRPAAAYARRLSPLVHKERSDAQIMV